MSVSAARSARIDCLRGLAIGVVLLLHFSLTYHLADGPLAKLVPRDWIRALVNNGNYGVTLFFVISGFLITSNNLRRHGELRAVKLREFYALRFARIIPPLLAALVVIVPLGLAGVASFDNRADGQPLPGSFMALAVLSVLTFWHNVLMQSAGYFNYCLNIYWSLSVEEVFYLLFPLACILLRRNVLIVVLCLSAIALAPWYRALHRDDEIYYLYAYPACFDAIAIGCLTALASARLAVSERLLRPLRWFCGVSMAVVYVVGFDGHEAFGFTLLALFAAPLLFKAFDAKGAAPLSPWLRPLAWFGTHSYELYLYHIIVLGILREILPRSAVSAAWQLPLLALFIALSALVAWTSARYFAEPVNAYLRRALIAPKVSSDTLRAN